MAIQSHANAGQDRPVRWTLGRDKLAIRPWRGTDPSILVGICVGLIIIGLIFALNLTDFDSLAAVAAFLKLPIWQRVAWLVVALSSLCLLAGTIWQSHQLAVQAKTIDSSAKRFYGLYEKVDALSLAQHQADQALQHLVTNSSEKVVDGLAQQLAEGEQRALAQITHYSAVDLENRIADIRQRQQPLRDQLAALVEKRQALDAVFMDLNHRQYLIERALSEVEKKEHAEEVETRLVRLTEFVKTAQFRFDDIDRLGARLTALRGEFGEVEMRLTPLQANRGLLENLTGELDALRDRFSAAVDQLERNGDRSLAERVQDFTTAKDELQDRVSRLTEQFGKLQATRNEIGTLLTSLNNSLEMPVDGARQPTRARVKRSYEQLSEAPKIVPSQDTVS
jgi:chromosome segregation ATPase